MKKMFVIALIAVLGVAGQVMAKDGHGKGGKEGRGGPECGQDEGCHQEKMKAMRAKMLREKVGLTEEKAKQVEGVLDGFHDRHVQLRKAFKENMKAIKDLVKADSADQDAYTKALLAMRDNHKAQQVLMDEQMEALKKVLTPKEQAKMFLAHQKMKMKMKKFMKGKHGKGGDGPHPDMD